MNPMLIRELAEMYGTSTTTMRTILCRSDFDSFEIDKDVLRDNPKYRRKGVYYDCSLTFDRVLKKHLRQLRNRKH